jgi:hypothetical protein
MNAFDFSGITCDACGAASKPGRSCSACGKDSFSVEIERSASGIDLQALFLRSLGTVGAFIDEATDDHASTYYRTHSFLRCGGIFGSEVVEFMKAPIEERKRMYVGWKRREIEAALDPGRGICDRCGVAFKRYENPWNRAGLCSRTCHHAYQKSQSH